MLSEMSSALTECVSAPTDTNVTPVPAMARIVSRVTLPDASVSIAPSIRVRASYGMHDDDVRMNLDSNLKI